MVLDWMGWMDGLDGWDLCAGLFYEHRFAMLIIFLEYIFVIQQGDDVVPGVGLGQGEGRDLQVFQPLCPRNRMR